MGVTNVTGLRLPYTDVAAGGQVHRIGSGMRAVLEAMLRIEPDEAGVRRVARSDLAASVTMGQRGDVSVGTKYNTIGRVVRAGALRVGDQKILSRRGHKAMPVELTDVGLEIARQLGLGGPE
jgi:hypothetical protein